MDSLHFFAPVHVARGPGHPVEEIESVAEALVFLREWPTGRRGPVYQCALRCCEAALAGQMTAEEARKSLASFIRITGLPTGRATPQRAPEPHVAAKHLEK